MRRHLFLLLGTVAVLTAFWAELRVQAGGTTTATWVDDLGELAAACTAAVAAAWRARQSSDRSRRSWTFIAAGAASWAVGQAIWSYYELLAGRATPFPSLADAGFLAFPVLALVGLCLRPAAAFDRSGRLRVLLDSLLVAASLFVLSWVTAFGQVFESGGSRLSLIVALSYPAGDLLLLTVTLVVVAHTRSSARLGLGLLAVGFAALSIADSGFAYLTAAGTFGSGNQIDAGWAAGFLILAIAAVYDLPGERAGQRAALSRSALMLPYLPATLGLALAAYRVRGHHADNVSLVTGLIIIFALLGRQLLVLSDNRRLMEVITRQAFYDDLTGLANRALFRDRLGHALLQHRRTLRPLSVLLLDVDDFKAVNDDLGHAAGDELLVHFAARLLGNVRSTDTVARLGGDEFAILTDDDAGMLPARILQSLAAPARIQGRPQPIRASIGFVHLGADEAPVDGDDLLDRADQAMYASKRRGKSQSVRYEPHLDREAGEERQFAVALAADIDAGRIRVAYQPLFAAHDQTLIGFESLARWEYRSCAVAPDHFLPVADTLGLMPALDLQVLSQAVVAAARWSPRGKQLAVTVNMEAVTLRQPDVAATVLRLLEGSGLAHDRLVIEILERHLLDETVLVNLRALRAIGVRVAIDDFGIGYSSFARLRDVSPDIVKIDRSFVSPLTDPDASTVVLHGLIDLIHRAGAVAVGEGVEHRDQLRRLIELDCDAIQGYLTGRPMPEASALALIDAAPVAWQLT
jgi:diguanylate cyclase (GGDEF)-like protein